MSVLATVIFVGAPRKETRTRLAAVIKAEIAKRINKLPGVCTGDAEWVANCAENIYRDMMVEAAKRIKESRNYSFKRRSGLNQKEPYHVRSR